MNDIENKKIDDIDERNAEIVGECPNCKSKNFNLRFDLQIEFYKYHCVTLVCADCGIEGKVQYVPYLIKNTVDWGEFGVNNE